MGKDFHKWEIPRKDGEPKKRKVVYVNLEMGEQMFMIRVAWHVLAVTKPDSYRFPITEGSAPEDEINKKPTKDEIIHVNEEIGDRFYFTDQLRRMTLATPPPEKSNPRDTAKGLKPKDWKKILHKSFDDIQPDLIVFDTLSKMHSIEEKDNNAIQNLLMLIRDIASAEPKLGEAAGSTNGARRRRIARRHHIAHVIVHHARKQAGDFKGGSSISLDAIRGGSAIRAEADVIIGLGVKKKAQAQVREMILEARNLAPDECWFNFDGLRFESCSKPNDNTDTDEQRLYCIRKVFADHNVRGIGIGKLPDLLKERRAWGTGAAAWKNFLKEQAEKSGCFQLVTKKTNAPADYDVSLCEQDSKQSGKIYWVQKGSEWLENGKITCPGTPPGGRSQTPEKKYRRKRAKRARRKASKKKVVQGAGAAVEAAPSAEQKQIPTTTRQPHNI